MNKVLEPTVDIAVEDIRQHPELLTNLILASEDRSIMLENRAGKVRITYLKSYAPETRRLLAEARQSYLEQKAHGYDREQAFQDLRQAQEEIAAHLRKADSFNHRPRYSGRDHLFPLASLP